MIRLCLVDDHAIVREGLKRILNSSKEIQVMDEFGTASEFIKHLKGSSWDLVILDLSLPDKNGIEVLKEIKKKQQPPKVIVLTMHNQEDYALKSFENGAYGYVTKESVAAELVNAVKDVSKGKKYVSSALAQKMVYHLGSKSSFESDLKQLSARELQVIKLLASGKRVQTIADQLSLSKKTVSTYKTRILQKLNLENTTDLIQYVEKKFL